MKFLITSDLHIKDTFKIDFAGEFRYNQYILLANIISDMCYFNDISNVIICGDNFDSPHPNPKAYHIFHNFLNILEKNDLIKGIYLIHGQHELNSKTDTKEKNLYISSIDNLYKKVCYCHNKKLPFYENSSYFEIFFRGWEPEFKEIPKCDIFIGHGYVDKAIVNKIIAHSDITENKMSNCKIAIMGDIHKSQWVGNIYCPGTPLQHSFSDDENTSFAILDSEKLSVPREAIEVISTVGKFMRFSHEYGESEYPMIIRRSQKYVNAEYIFDSPNSSIDYSDILNNILINNEYKEDILLCLGKTKIDDFDTSSYFKVKLIDIEINNFLSIKELKFNFTELNKLSILMGNNGSGKSSLVKAILWCLKESLIAGHGKESDLIFIGEDFCKVKLSLFYMGTTFTIERKRGKDTYLKCYIDSDESQEIEANNVTDFQKKLESILPIITKLDLLYFYQERDGLLSELSDSKRVSLINDLINLSIVDAYTTDIENEINILNGRYNILNNETTILFTKVNTYKNNLVEVQDPSVRMKEIDYEISENDKKKIQQKNIIQEIEKSITTEFLVIKNETNAVADKLADKRSELAVLQSQVKDRIKIINNLLSKKETWTCPTCLSIVNNKEFVKDKTDLEIELTKRVQQVNDLKIRFDELNQQISKIRTNDIVKLNNDETEIKLIKTKDYLNIIHSLDTDNSNLRIEMGGLKQVYKNYIVYLESKMKVKALEDELSFKLDEQNNVKMKVNNFIEVSKKVFGNSGLFIAYILEELSKKLNDNENIKITTTKVLKNGVVKPTIDVSMKIDEFWINYENLSGGERLYADLYFLTKVIDMIGGIGFLFLDETLKYSDPKYAQMMFELLHNAKIQNILLILHGESMLPVYTDHQLISVQRVDNMSKFLFT